MMNDFFNAIIIGSVNNKFDSQPISEKITIFRLLRKPIIGKYRTLMDCKLLNVSDPTSINKYS